MDDCRSGSDQLDADSPVDCGSRDSATNSESLGFPVCFLQNKWFILGPYRLASSVTNCKCLYIRVDSIYMPFSCLFGIFLSSWV